VRCRYVNVAQTCAILWTRLGARSETGETGAFACGEVNGCMTGYRGRARRFRQHAMHRKVGCAIPVGLVR
jgi:hypothetical protein